jgi:hypothetical protein
VSEKRVIPFDHDFMALLEAGSLGTPNAKLLRQQTSIEVLRTILERAKLLEGTEGGDI